MSKAPPKPQVRSSVGYLGSIEQRLAHCARYKDRKRLESYLHSRELMEGLAALEGSLRVRALHAVHRALLACLPPPPPKPGTVRAPSVVDPAGRQRIIDAWKQTGTDRGLAQLLQIPLPAAKTARWKVIGPIRQKPPHSTGEGADARQHQR